jgi:hypothetical protein
MVEADVAQYIGADMIQAVMRLTPVQPLRHGGQCHADAGQDAGLLQWIDGPRAQGGNCTHGSVTFDA